jgi:hypothetical protein
VGVVKTVINGLIGFINGAIHMINTNLIDTANKIPFVNIPHIPDVPRLHEGGVFTSGLPAGEGLAVLRDNELVVTPEQRTTADDLLRALLSGNLPGTTTTTTTAVGGAQVQIDVHAAPGMDVAELSAHVATDLGWSLSAGSTAPTARFAGSPA